MFQQFRKQYLILNMLTITALMLVAFVVIYGMMAENNKRGINNQLKDASDRVRLSEISKQIGVAVEDKHPVMLENGDDVPSRALCFSLYVNDNGVIQRIYSKVNLGKSLFDQVHELAWNQGSVTGQFETDTQQWSYVIEPFQDGKLITYLDVTMHNGFLTKLIQTFVAVTIGMLFIIYLISWMFANRSIKPLEAAFEKQKQFISDASHEFKTPLAVIQTNVDAILTNPEETIDSQSKWLHSIQSEVGRMTKLTNDLLYLTRIDETIKDQLVDVVALSEVVQQMSLTVEPLFYEKKLSFLTSIESDLKCVGDDEKLKQVILILLDNAMKYASPLGNVSIFLKNQNNVATLNVTNSGGPIAEEQLERIFERFVRLDFARQRSVGGYGLGLAIAKSIVQQHHGKMRATNGLDQTVSFEVELPLINE